MRSFSATLVDEIEGHGGTEIRIKIGRKHPQIRFVYQGKAHTFVFPNSPSDHRGIRNSLACLRRVMGVRRRH